jgi:hypothetical protein
MQVALKILNSVADTGLSPRNPEHKEKRSSLIRGLFMNKYERARLAPLVDPLRSELPPTVRLEESCL